jgi:PD-(D/E)XK nuclease superfamily
MATAGEAVKVFDFGVNDYIDCDLTHSVHTSERRSFRGCRRRWNWLFRHYYYPTTTAKPLEFGVAYHKGMEVFYQPEFWGAPREVVLQLAIQAFRGKCKEQLKKYEDWHGPAAPEVLADYRERVELGEGMLRYHEEKVYPELRDKYRPRKVEVSFEVPIPRIVKRPNGAVTVPGEVLRCKCKVCWKRFKEYLFQNGYDAFKNEVGKWISTEQMRYAIALADWGNVFWLRWQGLPVTYGGRIDCVMEDLEGRLWIFDWKTAAQLSEDRQEFLELDDQIDSYVWAMRVLGIDVIGFVYFEQRKAYGEEPEPMKVRRLGRSFSVSKSAAFDAVTYERVVSDNDPEAYAAGLYDDYIEWLREHGEHFHASYTNYRNDVQIAQTELSIAMEASEIVDPDLLIYKNAGRFSCGNCAFRQPCLSVNDGGDFQYALDTQFERRRYHYWVDKEPSTESKGGE